MTDAIFSALELGRLTGITSTITMTELLVPAYRSNNEGQVDEFYALFSRYPNLEWIPVSLEIADMAAELRAIHSLRTPDALQAATAIHSRTAAMITNDLMFKRVEQFETFLLDRILR